MVYVRFYTHVMIAQYDIVQCIILKLPTRILACIKIRVHMAASRCFSKKRTTLLAILLSLSPSSE